MLIKNKEWMMLTRNVVKTGEGIKISFGGSVKKEKIVKMVENCATGQCACMSDESKAKLKDMKVTGTDGEVALDLVGDLTTEEIEAALARSTVINNEEV
jgi:hypothetical protein